MTTQAGAAVATAAQQPPTPKTVKARRNWGDVLLRVVAGLVLLYLFLPIFVIILFSFNTPGDRAEKDTLSNVRATGDFVYNLRLTTCATP